MFIVLNRTKDETFAKKTRVTVLVKTFSRRHHSKLGSSWYRVYYTQLQLQLQLQAWTQKVSYGVFTDGCHPSNSRRAHDGLLRWTPANLRLTPTTFYHPPPAIHFRLCHINLRFQIECARCRVVVLSMQARRQWQCFFALADLAGATELAGLLYVNTRPDFVRAQLYYEA